MRFIQLGGHQRGSVIRGYAIVDDGDYDRLNQHNWHKSAQGYAVRTTLDSETPPRKVVFMHREILGLPRNPGRATAGQEQGNHINFNTIDNRRENLEVVTPSGNLQHRWERDKTPECPRCGSADDWSYSSKGYRSCLACKRADEKTRIARKKQDPEWVEQQRAYKREKAREYLQDPVKREAAYERTRRWRAEHQEHRREYTREWRARQREQREAS